MKTKEQLVDDLADAVGRAYSCLYLLRVNGHIETEIEMMEKLVSMLETDIDHAYKIVKSRKAQEVSNA